MVPSIRLLFSGVDTAISSTYSEDVLILELTVTMLYTLSGRNAVLWISSVYTHNPMAHVPGMFYTL